MDAAALITLYVELVALVKSLHVSFDHFHLTACGGCGMPAFQQPCPMCGYYPMGNDPAERKRCQEEGITEERWVRAVERSCGIVAWYITEHCRNTVAWTSLKPLWIQWRSEMEALIASSKTMTLPDARTILAAVKAVAAEEKADQGKDWDERMKRYHQIEERAQQLCEERGEKWNKYARRQGYGKVEPSTYQNPTVEELLAAERGINETP